MTKRERIIAAVLAALVALVVLSSAAFMIGHADHDCTGEDCPVCARLVACAHNLRSLAAAAVVVYAAAVFAAVSPIRAAGDLFAYAPRTPVALKVKLSN